MITFVEASIELSDALWDEWLAALVQAQGKKRMLTSWGDIQPTKDQWRRATRAMRDSGHKVAVVTESRTTSALAKAASWAGVDMQAFRWEQLYEAGVFLGLDSSRRTAARTAVTALRDCFGAVDGGQVERAPATAIATSTPLPPPTPIAPSRPAASASSSTPQPTARPRPTSGASKTPMADAASQNLARVRQTSEEIQAKLAEVQARLRNRTRT